MTQPFDESRRQVFLQQKYFVRQIFRRDKMQQAIASEMEASDTSIEDASLLRATEAEQKYEQLSLRYTAGEPIEPLRGELASVIEAYERYQQALAIYEGEPRMPPLGLDQLGDYERCMQLIGLCYLLHRRDLLPRLSALIDPGYRGEDTLYEDLMAFAEPGRIDLDEWYHAEPYTPLVQAMYEPDQTASSALLKQYCESWYPAFECIPWHDGHKRMTETDGDYFGYWAFEAGAVALLCDIDDSRIDHLAYPKDLVAWARKHAALSGDAQQPDAVLRCAAGASCPRSGFWLTPASEGSRRRFDAGETMPAVGESDYGKTIWQWDPRQ